MNEEMQREIMGQEHFKFRVMEGWYATDNYENQNISEFKLNVKVEGLDLIAIDQM
jgi:hypothetical protein